MNDFGAQSHGVWSRCLSLKVQGLFLYFFGGMRAASLDNAIAGHMDTIRWPDPPSTNACFSSGIARLSGPIWDRANRVTQVCHLPFAQIFLTFPDWRVCIVRK